MPSLWRHLQGRFDRSINPKWGWRVSALYGMGVWTLLGIVFVKWMSGGETIVALGLGLSTEQYNKLTEDEKDGMIQRKKLNTWKRQQELAEHVAENIYSPADFMG